MPLEQPHWRSPFVRAISVDTSLPMDRVAVQLWLKDMHNPLRWIVRPVFQFVFGILLHITWALKRLPLPQFRAHGMLQWMICWFCRNFVSREASVLILRHFATESNILNFLRDNTAGARAIPLQLYPRKIDDLLEHTFVRHDQELFRMMGELGEWTPPSQPRSAAELNWSSWRTIDVSLDAVPKRWTQCIDFETAHSLFMSLFCLLLTAEEYRDSINGFNLDQSIAIRIAKLIGDPTLVELAYNKYPLYFVGPWNLAQRFLMHGFFTEHLYARLERLRTTGA